VQSSPIAASALFCFLATVPFVHAENAQSIDRAKKATALVRVLTDGKPSGYGSAFCLDELGLFVTNAHVADGKSNVELVLDSGEISQRIIPARVLRSEPKLDLAILQLQRPSPCVALPIAAATALRETMDITALGYPFGAAMSLDGSGLPSISINIGHVTSLRKKGGELELIQVDAALNPGNSGGPVLDGSGQVIGIVEAGIMGSGVNFVIPIQRLDKLLKEPLVAIFPTTLAYEKRSETQAVAVKVLTADHPEPGFNVELALNDGQSAPRARTAATKDGTAKFNIPLAPAPMKSATPLQISGTFPEGVVTGRSADHTLKVGDQTVKLSDIKSIDFDSTGAATVTVGDKTVTGPIHDLDSVALTIGGAQVKPKWAQATHITVTSAETPVRSVEYSIKIHGKDKVVAQANGTFDFTGDIPEGAINASEMAHAPSSSGNLWEMLRSAVKANQTTESSAHGGSFSMKTVYSDVPAEGGVLVGFRYTLGDFMHHPMIESLQPIYITGHGEKLGEIQGKATHPAQTIRARAGYCVTGMTIRAGGNFDGFSLVYTRFQGNKLVPSETYKSDWVGQTDGGRVYESDTQGGFAVGITGKKADKIGSLALVIVNGSGQPSPARTASAKSVASNPMPPSDDKPPLPVLPGKKKIEQPAQGDPYTSFEQMFDTLPTSLQPHGDKWYVGTRVSPDLTGRLRGKPVLIIGEFASTKTTDKGIEATFDAEEINYRGFQLVGEIIVRFPASQADKLKTLRIHDKITISGTIEQMVVRGGNINKAFLWINDAQMK
jgi:S1-C subfamily serine protease